MQNFKKFYLLTLVCSSFHVSSMDEFFDEILRENSYQSEDDYYDDDDSYNGNFSSKIGSAVNNILYNMVNNGNRLKKKRNLSPKNNFLNYGKNINYKSNLNFLNDRNYNITSKMLPRSVFFSEKILTHIALSPCAKFSAFSRINKRKYEIVIKSINNKYKKSFVVNGEVLSLKFLDDFTILYVLRDRDGKSYLYVANFDLNSPLRVSSISINNEDTAKSIKILKCKKNKIAIELFDGTFYYIYLIDLKNSKTQFIHKSIKSESVIFNLALKPVAFFSDFHNKEYSVFQNSTACEFEYNFETTHDINMPIDIIKNSATEKYISAGTQSLYKIKLKNNKISLLKVSKDSKEILKEGYISNAPNTLQANLDNYSISINSKGVPIFANFLGEKGSCLPLYESDRNKQAISYLNKKCGSNWYRSDSSADGNIWLICIRKFNRGNEYCLYDLRSNIIKRLKSSNPGLKNLALRSKMYIRSVEIENGKAIPISITLPKNMAKSPLVILLQMKGCDYKKGFMPLSEFLANRGYAVITVNYKNKIDFSRIKKDRDAKEKFYATIDVLSKDIIKLIQKCKTKFGNGKVCIAGEGLGGAVAQKTFAVNENLFSGLINVACPIFDFVKNKKNHKNKSVELEDFSDDMNETELLDEDTFDDFEDASYNKRKKKPILVVNSQEYLEEFDENLLNEYSNLNYYSHKNAYVSDLAKATYLEYFLAYINNSKTEPLERTIIRELEPVSEKFSLFKMNEDEIIINYD